MKSLNDDNVNAVFSSHLHADEQILQWAYGNQTPKLGLIVFFTLIFFLPAIPIIFGVASGLTRALGFLGAVLGTVFGIIAGAIIALPSLLLLSFFTKRYIAALTNQRLMLLRFSRGLKTKELLCFDLKELPYVRMGRRYSLSTLTFDVQGTLRTILFPLSNPPHNAQRAELILRELIPGVTRDSFEFKQCPQCAESIRLLAQKCRYCGYEYPEEEIGAAKQHFDNERKKRLEIEKRNIALQKSLIIKKICGWLLVVPSVILFLMVIAGSIAQGNIVSGVIGGLILFSLPFFIGLWLLYKAKKLQNDLVKGGDR